MIELDKNEWTTIGIRKATHEALTEIGTKGQSYDDIVRMLINAYPDGNKKTKSVQKNSPVTAQK